MNSRSRRSRSSADNLWKGVLIVAATALVAYLLSLFSFFEGLELRLYNLNFQLRGARPVAETPIAVVAIDQQSADSLSFPFNRRHYAELVRQLNRLGARLIVFDIDFSSVGIIPESDSLFQSAIEEARNVILCGKISYRYHRGLKQPIAEVKPPSSHIAPQGTPWGLENDLVDPDGVNRRYPLFLVAGDTILSLGLKTYSVLNGLEGTPLKLTDARDLRFGDLQIPLPVTDISSTPLNYYGSAGTFPTYSFISVLRGDYDFDALIEGLSQEEAALLEQSGMTGLFAESPFKDKIVLIGASAEDLQDNKFTPFFSGRAPRKTPGVEVHANALQMLFDRNFIRAVDIWWVRAALIILCLLVYLAVRFMPQWMGLAAAALLLGAVALGGVTLFANQGLWLREMPLLLGIVVAYPFNLVYRFILAQKEKAMIRGMFAQYVPEKVVGELLANPDKLKLGGEKRRMSVLFCDVAGFTTVAEKLTPEALVDLLNEYLTAMSVVILEYDGIIDKYEGDLVMAEFGAPIWVPDHATRACRAALGMEARLRRLREKWRADGKVELFSRTGINTGEMIVGNMGSEKVFDYTVMGDPVNLASRLEGANKNYGTTIMIGKGTWDDVNTQFITRPLDLLRVKGKTEPVEVFELLAEKPEELSQQKLKALELYSQGILNYRERWFKEAGELFAKAMEADPGDGPSQVYHERAARYFIDPPPADWDGGWTLMEK